MKQLGELPETHYSCELGLLTSMTRTVLIALRMGYGTHLTRRIVLPIIRLQIPIPRHLHQMFSITETE